MEGRNDVVVVEERRDAAAYGFTVRAVGNGLLHRIAPMRDPQQPRFWCVVVFRLSAAGIADEAERPWVGPGGLRREELKEALGSIRADPSAWLAAPAHRGLRTWMLDPDATPPALPPHLARLVPVRAAPPHVASDPRMGRQGAAAKE
ncbi:MAG: hypothetical protein K0Q71_1073 [Thermomicrobiales bacterium]|nr:hypothetical protein [Thermomicrobiales bacterium]